MPVINPEISATAKFADPPTPAVIKTVLGPDTYSATDGFTIGIEELKEAPIVKVLGPFVGADGSLIVATSVVPNSPNSVVVKFGYIKADTSTGAITVAALADSSTALSGVPIYVIAVGDTDRGTPTVNIIPPPQNAE